MGSLSRLVSCFQSKSKWWIQMTPSVWLISCFATETKTGGVHENPNV